jgi:RNA ligase
MRPSPLLSDICDVDALDRLVADGFVAMKRHPNAPLRLYDYTARTQYEGMWTPETMLARGLIVHDDGRLWARPFPKFRNVGEHDPDELPLHETFHVFDKLDGSLGILYAHPVTGAPAIATRGSFASEQALHATEVFLSRYAGAVWPVPAGETWLFEIIYPSNRIVVDYGGMDDLVLLARIEIAEGRDLPIDDVWPGPVVTRHEGFADLMTLARVGDGQGGEDAEGFVVRFESGLRVKVKFEDYVRLHRLVTGVSTKTVWEHLSAGLPLDEMLDRVPDEFHRWLQDTIATLTAQFAAIEDECRAVMADRRVDREDRKATAALFVPHPHRAVLFAMLDAKRYDHLIWRTLKPEFAKPFATDPDA